MSLTTVHPGTRNYWAKRGQIVGAFFDADFLLFDRILSYQEARGVTGDLLEIGALYGKSAIVLGLHARPGEEVVICDIFENATDDAANDLENADSYSGLSRGRFEANYAEFVGTGPRIVQALSDTIGDHVQPASLRFAHVDGGHLYETVRDDIANVRGLLGPGGVLVMDDFRALHTPGVAAATWAAVDTGGLIPVAVSEQKFYGSFDPSAARVLHAEIAAWADAHSAALHFGVQSIAGHDVLVMQNPKIWTPRRRVRSLVPPIVADSLSRTGPPHLGT